MLRDSFTRARSEHRAALIAYLPAGFPDVGGGIDALRAMVDAGVDIVEVGVPYSDPLMDGATIQRAVETALAAGTAMIDVLRTVEAVAATGAVPLVMSYWNPIEQYGVDRFAHDLREAGGGGVITPDLTPEEAQAPNIGQSWMAASDREGLDRIFLVAQSSSPERLRIVADATTGFVYAASLMGVTGARTTLDGGAEALVSRTREVTELPVAVGLGVSTGAQAADIARYADGVIVGSAFVARLLDAADRAAGVRSVAALVEELATGVRAVGPGRAADNGSPSEVRSALA